MELKKVFRKSEEKQEAPVALEEPKVVEYEHTTFGICKVGNEWGLYKIKYSQNHDQCNKELLRTDLYKDVIFEEFKIQVSKEILC